MELRTIIGTINQPFDSFKRSEYGIPVYSNFSGAKYEECEQNVINSVGTRLRYLSVLDMLSHNQTQFCNIQLLFPVIPNVLAEREQYTGCLDCIPLLMK